MNQPEPTPTLAGKTIVTVEDEPVTQLHLKRILTRAGLRVVGQAMNGAEGVEVILRERPDLVLMDVNMPEIDGLEATQLVLAEWNACIIILTTYGDPQTQHDVVCAGACGYFCKPATEEELLPMLAQVYAERCTPR